MPSLGADMEFGTLVDWRVQPGDTVKRGDVVALVETEKGVIEVEIFENGVVESLVVQPGQKVPWARPWQLLAATAGLGNAAATGAAATVKEREAPPVNAPVPTRPPPKSLRREFHRSRVNARRSSEWT